MPELPEVETIVRFLNPVLSGRKILDVEIFYPRVIHPLTVPEDLKRKIIGRKIQRVERAGKNIVLNLSDGNRVLFHLMMTGKLFWNPKGKRKHDRLCLFFSGGEKLIFNDIRQFGFCRALGSKEEISSPDFLQISLADFRKKTEKTERKVKTFLLDQKKASGIGNIYADEILWEASVDPRRPVKSLNVKEVKKIFLAARKILKLAIKKGGTSSRDYRKPDGSKGGYYEFRKAYQRTGEKCRRDGEFIKKITVGGRSTHFCPRHQK